MGMELAGGIIGFLALGWLIGWAFGAAKTGLIAGAVLGSIGGLYNFIRQAMAVHRREQQRWEARSRGQTEAARRDLAESGATDRTDPLDCGPDRESGVDSDERSGEQP